VAYVLGASLEQGLERVDYGNQLAIISMVYTTVLRKAHQRTFNLQQRNKEVKPDVLTDPDIDAVVDARR
jgi:hypothetical protein